MEKILFQTSFEMTLYVVCNWFITKPNLMLTSTFHNRLILRIIAHYPPMIYSPCTT